MDHHHHHETQLPAFIHGSSSRNNNNNNNNNNKNNSTRKSSNNGSNEVKVKYISTPMRVNTTPAGFRSLVQQLTGKNSDTQQCFEESQTQTEEAQFLSTDSSAMYPPLFEMYNDRRLL